MNASTISAIGALFPSAHVFNVAPLTAAALGTTDIAFSFKSSSVVAALAVPSGAEILGSRTAVMPEVNAAMLGESSLVPRSRSGRPYFNSASFDSGRPFRVRAMFTADLTADGSTATTVVFKLYKGSSATLGSDVNIGSTGAAISIAATKVAHLNAMIEADLHWDSVSQSLAGIYRSMISGSVDTSTAATVHQVVAPAAMLNGPCTAITAVTGLSFLASCTIGTTAASAGSVSLQELSIEQI